jgi:hypothetical protein
MMEWVAAIQNSILWSLSHAQSVQTAHKGAAIAPDEALARLRENPGNRVCADCGAADPDWASINLGVLVCLQCSGVHRSLGVHVSKVRSATLDEWPPALLGFVSSLGGARANTFWEGVLPEDRRITPAAPRAARDAFTRAKYVERAFASWHCDRAAPLAPQLYAAVQSDDLRLALELVVAGADKTYTDPASGASIMGVRGTGCASYPVVLTNASPLSRRRAWPSSPSRKSCCATSGLR